MKKGLLIILILAALLTALAGYISDFPFPIFQSVLCIEMLEVSCPPRILLANILVDFLFWFVILTAGWWVLKFVLKKSRIKR